MRICGIVFSIGCAVEGSMPNMTIMRGGPGSGKSTVARRLADASHREVVICSADDLFVNDAGVYSFNPMWLGRAHGACLKKCVEAMVIRNDVIVDNTNASHEDMIPYLALCQAFGYTCTVVRTVCSPHEAGGRQIHGVPRETFDRIFTSVMQHQVPKIYKNAPWITIKDVRTGRDHGNRPLIFKPYSGARCIKCGGIIIYNEHGRYADDEQDTCRCFEGREEPGEPFPGLDQPTVRGPICDESL